MEFIKYGPNAWMATNATKEVDIIQQDDHFEVYVGAELFGRFANFHMAQRHVECEVAFYTGLGEIIASA